MPDALRQTQSDDRPSLACELCFYSTAAISASQSDWANSFYRQAQDSNLNGEFDHEEKVHPMNDESRPSCKIVLLGNSGVGKTTLVMRWTNGVFEKDIRPTIGANHQRKVVKIGADDIDLYLWDTAGQEQFQALTPLYARAAAAAVIVASITDESSFTALDAWRDMISNSCDNVPPMVLLVNKIDLIAQADMSNEDIETNFGPKFSGVFFVSAQSGEGVDDALMHAATIGYKFQVSANSSRKKVSPSEQNSGGCC
jgi:small GTP-binding protein